MIFFPTREFMENIMNSVNAMKVVYIIKVIKKNYFM